MLVLHIPEPCHQNWDEMPPETKGRFCGSCQKIVVDFTQLSDEQVKNYLLDKKNTNTCGRFKASQLGRPLEHKRLQIDPIWYQKLPFARQVFYAFAVFFVLGVSSCNFNGKMMSQSTQDSSSQTNKIPKINTNLEVGEIGIREQDSIPPPKVEMINHPGPILTGDVAITEPAPVKELQGAPLWLEEPQADTTKEIMGRFAAPKPNLDSVKKEEAMIMGGIAMPTPMIKDSIPHIKKPRR